METDRASAPDEAVAEIRDLYEIAFPGRRLRLHLRAVDAPARNPDAPGPFVVAAGETFDPAALGDAWLGVEEAGDPASTAPAVEAVVSIFRRPTEAEKTSFGRAPAFEGGAVRQFVDRAPLAYETLRHGADLIRRRWSRIVHRWRPWPPDARAETPDPDAPPLNRDRPPAIIIGMHWLEHGGAEAVAFDSLRWALTAGLRVFVVAAHDGMHRRINRLPDHENVRFLRADRYLPRALMPVFLRNLALRENVRIAHIQHCTPLHDALPALRSAIPDITVIDTTHIIEHGNGGYPRVAGAWTHFVDHHHVISHELGAMLRDRFGAPADKIRLGRLLRREDGAARAPFRLKPGARTLTIAYVARMTRQKRPVLTALAMGRIARWAAGAGVDLRFEVVGEGPFLPVFLRMLDREGITGRVTLHPENARVPDVLNRCDILLLPSANEGLALVCYEAIRHGVVPLATDVGAQAELLPEALLLPPAPRAALARATATVAALATDAAFLEAATAALVAKFEAIAAEPTAEEALGPLYAAAAGRREEAP